MILIDATAVKTERGYIEGSGLDSFPPSIRNVHAEETRQEAVKGSCVTAGCRSQTLIPTLASLSQIKVWTANPQQFVEDEDDDTFSYSVRISAQDLLLVRGVQSLQSLVFCVQTGSSVLALPGT